MPPSLLSKENRWEFTSLTQPARISATEGASHDKPTNPVLDLFIHSLMKHNPRFGCEDVASVTHICRREYRSVPLSLCQFFPPIPLSRRDLHQLTSNLELDAILSGGEAASTPGWTADLTFDTAF